MSLFLSATLSTTSTQGLSANTLRYTFLAWMLLSVGCASDDAVDGGAEVDSTVRADSAVDAEVDRDAMMDDATVDDAITPGDVGPPDAAEDGGPRPVPGTRLVNLSTCASTPGFNPPLALNVTDPIAVFGENRYVTWLAGEADDPHIIVTRYDGDTCLDTTRLEYAITTDNIGGHDTPAIYVDGLGNLYIADAGQIFRQEGGGASAPFLRRSVRSEDITEWTSPERMRTWDYTEPNGMRLNDGSVLIAGADQASRIDIIEPGGAYRWPSARVVISQDTGVEGGGPEMCAGNRFTKAAYFRTATAIYVVWGWARGPGVPPIGDCRAHFIDSHEVFFAYSTDEGETWSNVDGTKEVAAPLCTTHSECNRLPGISHNDPAFHLTTTRQKRHRGLWEHDDGTLYVVFAKSGYCDSGFCPTRRVTEPGALTLLTFTLGGTVDETTVNAEEHDQVAGVRRDGNDIYLWTRTVERTIYEYVSRDGGPWERTMIRRGCDRLMGLTDVPGDHSIHLTFSCGSDVFLYERTF